MNILSSFRVVIFILIILLSFVVLGVCAHFESLSAGYVDVYSFFIPLGLGVSSLSIVSLTLFLALGYVRGAFTSMILFEIIWFFILLVLWVGVAGDAAFGRAYFFPYGCVVDYYYVDAVTSRICSEYTVVEAFSFFGFFSAFVYFAVIFLYAIVNAIRGRGVWTTSVREAATGTPGTVNAGVQPQFNAPPGTQFQYYGTYPANVSGQPYTVPPQQVPPQGPFVQSYPYPQPGVPQGLPFNAYPQQVPPQNAYAQQPLQGTAPSPPAQNPPYNYTPAPGSPQQQVNYAAYSPGPPANDASPPHPSNYGSHPVSGQSPPPLLATQPASQHPQLPASYSP